MELGKVSGSHDAIDVGETVSKYCKRVIDFLTSQGVKEFDLSLLVALLSLTSPCMLLLLPLLPPMKLLLLLLLLPFPIML